MNGHMEIGANLTAVLMAIVALLGTVAGYLWGKHDGKKK